MLLIITYIVIFHKIFFRFFQNILESLQRLTGFASIFIINVHFNIHDNKETNILFLFLLKTFPIVDFISQLL